MEIDLFPVVTAFETLGAAFDVMTHSNRSALVVDSGPESGSRYAFVEAVDIVIAMAEQSANVLGPLTGRTPLRLVQPRDVGLTAFLFGVNLADAALERYFEASMDRFVLLAITGTRAVVASRNESDMPEQASPKDCFCTIDRKPVSPGKNYGNCPYDARHGGSVRCR